MAAKEDKIVIECEKQFSSWTWPFIYLIFNTREHVHIGSKISVPLTEGNLLTLSNGTQLSFEQIVALAGDYYGVPGSQIINPNYLVNKTDNEVDIGRRKRFMAAYDTLAKAPRDKIVKRLEKLVTMIEEETQSEEASNKESGKIYFHSDKEWDEATGGVWVGGIPIVPGGMLKLAESNSDHFQPQAKHAYLTGHVLAIEKAQEAAKIIDVKEQKMMLMEAYSIDAFACHFLTDSFSSGHIRTPRVELGNSTTPAQVGHLLSKYMHDEDNDFGLRVTNVRGDKWVAYGDGMLMKKESEENLRLVVEIVQQSVNQIHKAFSKPNASDLLPSLVTDLMPFVDSTATNNSPLFQMKDGKLHRRSDIGNLQDTNTTRDWWGTTTTTALQFSKKKNSAIPPV